MEDFIDRAPVAQLVEHQAAMREGVSWTLKITEEKVQPF